MLTMQQLVLKSVTHIPTSASLGDPPSPSAARWNGALRKSGESTYSMTGQSSGQQMEWITFAHAADLPYLEPSCMVKLRRNAGYCSVDSHILVPHHFCRNWAKMGSQAILQHRAQFAHCRSVVSSQSKVNPFAAKEEYNVNHTQYPCTKYTYVCISPTFVGVQLSRWLGCRQNYSENLRRYISYIDGANYQCISHLHAE